MELHFCDLCSEAVPQDDIENGQAFSRGQRIVCRACNDAMGGALGLSEANSGDASSNGASSAPSSTIPARRGPVLAPGVSAALAMASIVLTLVAVVALLVRIEDISRSWKVEYAHADKRIDQLKNREAGTRAGMIAQAQQVTDDVLRSELKRFERLERQISELRLALAAGGDVETGLEMEAAGTVDASLLTLGDAMERVGELEEQVLFLQARVYDLVENGRAPAVMADLDVEAKPPLPEGSVGDLVTRLSAEDPIERVEALYALSRVSDQGIVRHLTPLLDDGDAYIRSLTARLLERSNAHSAVQPLIERLEDPDPQVRECVVSALRVITGEEFRFDPVGSRGARSDAVRRWRLWWTQNWKTFLYEEE